MNELLIKKFSLNEKLVVITGGAGFLGVKHAEAVAEAGGIPVLWDINQKRINEVVEHIYEKYKIECYSAIVDITDEVKVNLETDRIITTYGCIDILINNAANDPKVKADSSVNVSRLENFDLNIWRKDIDVGLTGAFVCSKYIGYQMAKVKKGVIINIASDLGIIAPDQRLYMVKNASLELQPVKPVTYSVVKHGLIGLTKYIATYWADSGVRCNALAPGGVFNDQGEDFVKRILKLIPMGRMANQDEYKAAIVFLASDASSYMNGSVLVIDGGRTCW